MFDRYIGVFVGWIERWGGTDMGKSKSYSSLTLGNPDIRSQPLYMLRGGELEHKLHE